jgi:hypothetical protein
MLIPTPLPISSKAKNPFQKDLNSQLRSQYLPSSAEPNLPPRKKYRDRTFTSQPQPQELEVYLGWTTSDVIAEMRDLGYNVVLNVPQSFMYFDLGFGYLHFHFEPDQLIILTVKFHPKIMIS